MTQLQDNLIKAAKHSLTQLASLRAEAAAHMYELTNPGLSWRQAPPEVKDQMLGVVTNNWLQALKVSELIQSVDMWKAIAVEGIHLLKMVQSFRPQLPEELKTRITELLTQQINQIGQYVTTPVVPSPIPNSVTGPTKPPVNEKHIYNMLRGRSVGGAILSPTDWENPGSPNPPASPPSKDKDALSLDNIPSLSDMPSLGDVDDGTVMASMGPRKG